MSQLPALKSPAIAAANLPATKAEPSPARITEALYNLATGLSEARGDGPDAATVDRLFHALIGRATQGISPAGLTLAWLDWLIHLGMAPGKAAELVQKAMRKSTRFGLYAMHWMSDPATKCCIQPLPQDHRFVGDAWQQPPFNFIYQSFLLTQQWWYNATTGIKGVSAHHERAVEFTARQLLDLAAPSNFLLTNPEILKQTVAESGANLVRGWVNLIEDWERAIAHRPPVGADAFPVGVKVAVTPGQVIFRNRLIELIQYSPATPDVKPEPILIVPAWIMKYYILDLSPHNSLVKYLVDQGYTVFMISWKNPEAADRDLGMEDYFRLGVMDALSAISTILPDRKVHAAGYCLGGTLLATAAAAMARDDDDRLRSVTLFAAQTDFTEAGELTLFVSDSELAFLEDVMWTQGYLDARQMSGAFQLLRSNDLIWSRMLKQYLLGEREPMNDLMAWNSDSTRMPQRMHAEYLRRFFLNNELAEGVYRVGGRPVAMTDIRVPIFAVGTTRDHVAPWRSTYKIHILVDTDVTYVLTTGGHNAGIVSEPGHPNRSYQIAIKHPTDKYEDPDSWAAHTPHVDGSWWPAWVAWLDERSGEPVAQPPMGAARHGYAPFAPAPGTYVLRD
ncbi:MAG: alpha/beta fold hydrolase [Dongiaceae bacterium]